MIESITKKRVKKLKKTEPKTQKSLPKVFESKTNTIFNGVCVNCEYNTNCNYRANSEKAIFFCEEYELKDYPIVNLPKHINKEKSIPVQHKPQIKGLCSNCELKETCTYPKSEGGVWHCEEYL